MFLNLFKIKYFGFIYKDVILALVLKYL